MPRRKPGSDPTLRGHRLPFPCSWCGWTHCTCIVDPDDLAAARAEVALRHRASVYAARRTDRHTARRPS